MYPIAAPLLPHLTVLFWLEFKTLTLLSYLSLIDTLRAAPKTRWDRSGLGEVSTGTTVGFGPCRSRCRAASPARLCGNSEDRQDRRSHIVDRSAGVGHDIFPVNKVVL